ncbi:hypothetical protein IIC68_00890 [archaeon]|nr:hypothetical protein [archaeon]
MQLPITIKKFHDKIKLVDDLNETLFIANDTPADTKLFLYMRDCLNACDGMEDPLNDMNALILEANKPDKKVDWWRTWAGMAMQGLFSSGTGWSDDEITDHAKDAFDIADAMMAEAEKRTKGENQ